MPRTATLAVIAALAGAIALASAFVRYASGALAPWAYKQLHDEAPEAVEILTQAVEVRRMARKGRDGDYVHRSIAASARIENVRRSAVGFKPGDTIGISYSIGEPMPRPWLSHRTGAGNALRSVSQVPPGRPMRAGGSLAELRVSRSEAAVVEQPGGALGAPHSGSKLALRVIKLKS